MRYKVVVRREAQHDAAEAFLWYENRSPGLGSRFATMLEECLFGLAEHPHYGVRSGKFRHVLIKKFPYRVVFTVEEEVVYVYQIRHTSRRPSKRFGP